MTAKIGTIHTKEDIGKQKYMYDLETSWSNYSHHRKQNNKKTDNVSNTKIL